MNELMSDKGVCRTASATPGHQKKFPSPFERAEITWMVLTSTVDGPRAVPRVRKQDTIGTLLQIVRSQSQGSGCSQVYKMGCDYLLHQV